MQRKPSFSFANCNIKMPDGLPITECMIEEEEPIHRRQQLINFGHAQWGFNNWSWSVTKQDLDFVEISNGKYTAGVVAFVSVVLKTVDIHRENIGYATSIGPNKGSAIYRARKCAVTNALRETLLSFGGSIATELTDLLDTHKQDVPAAENPKENNPNVANNLPNHPANNHVKHAEHKVANVSVPPTNFGQPHNHKEPNHPINHEEVANHHPIHHKEAPNHHLIHKEAHYPINHKEANQIVNKEPPNQQIIKEPPTPIHKEPTPQHDTLPRSACRPTVKSAPPPVARAQPMPMPPNAPPRPQRNVSFVLQPVMGGMVPPVYPRPPAPLYPNYYEYPWHYCEYDRSGSRPRDCKPEQCWIKPTIFYDGFWTEQKVKRWVAEQVEKQFPERHDEDK